MRRSFATLTLALCSCIVMVELAEAQASTTPADTLVLSVGGQSSDDEAEAARNAVLAALTAAGATPLSETDLALRVAPGRLAGCQATGCAYEIARELSLGMAVAVAYFAPSGETAGQLALSLIVSPTATYLGRAEVENDDLNRAATSALRAANAERRRVLLVQGTDAPPDNDAETQSNEEENNNDVRVEGLGLTYDIEQSEGRPLEQWVLPSLLGAMGLGLVGMSVYALMDEMCDVRGATTGDCLVGTRPNIGLGTVAAVIGGLSVAGAVIWFIFGAEPGDMGDLDVMVHNEGATVRLRGRF